MKLESGHEIVPLDDEEMQKQQKDFKAYTNGLVRLMPGGWIFYPGFEKVGDKIYNFQYKKSDVVLMTWPKSGTTWAQEILWTMRNNPNLDNKAASESLLIRAPFPEMDMIMGVPDPDEVLESFHKLCKGRDPRDGVHLQIAECSPEPRTLKTHLALSLLSPSMLNTCKVVYVARNPKDVIVSYYHHSRLLIGHSYVGSFADFVQYFLDGDLLYGPYWLHLKEVWEKRNHPNVLFLFYEDMKENPLKEIKKIDAFIGTHLTEEQMNGIVKYTSFEEMKKRNESPAVGDTSKGAEQKTIHQDVLKEDGGFFRKGESGGWKSYFTPDLEVKVNDWIKKHLDSIGIHFKYEV